MKPTDYSHCKNLEEVIASLYHGSVSEHTINRNECIVNAAKQCTSGMELGVFQGSCLALIYTNLQSPKELYGVDIRIDPYNKGGLSSLFKEYAQRTNNSPPEIIQSSSINKDICREVDFLHIDSLHQANHLKKELDLHSPFIKKYIAFHDINQNNSELGKVVKNFVKNSIEWDIEVYYDQGICGHALIRRI